MRKVFAISLIIALFLAACYPNNCNAQTVTLNLEQLNKLPDDVKKQLANVGAIKSPATVDSTKGKYTGIGKEIGLAVKESLSAVTTEVSKFADTKAGKMTMFIVVYKLIGRDLLHYTLGVGLLILMLLSAWWFYSTFAKPHRILIKDTYDKESKQHIKEWKLTNDDYDVNTNWKIAIMCYVCVGFLISIAVFFG